jgi:parvulin-like peptidyl-prolyl isomerase
MAVLETIRVKFGILITVLIAVALLSFIIDPTSLSLFSSDAESQDLEVASVNGKGVTYTEFNNQYRLYTDAYAFEYYEAAVRQRNPELTTEDIRTLYSNELRARALNDFLMANHYVPKAKAAGFNVSQEEMYQLLSGQMFSNTIYSEFGGQMTPELLIQVEANSNQPVWENLKKSVENERYLAKYTDVFSKSLFSNSLLVEENIKNSNNVFDVEFVMVPFDVTADTSVVATEQEIADYYAAHKDLFKTAETRVVDYVVVDVNAETEDAEYDKLENALAGAKDFKAAAEENGYIVASETVNMYATVLGSVAEVENLVKWAFKEKATGGVSDIFTVVNGDNTYLIIGSLAQVNEAGYAQIEDVKAAIGATLQMEKAADKKLAEVTEKVAGLNDLAAVAEALGTSVSTREKLTFASSDFDQKFTGAASVAEQGVVSAPFKGSNGIYVFKVTNVDQAAFFTESDAQMNDAQLNYKYGQVLPYVVNEEGNVTDNTYLYF